MFTKPAVKIGDIFESIFKIKDNKKGEAKIKSAFLPEHLEFINHLISNRLDESPMVYITDDTTEPLVFVNIFGYVLQQKTN